MRKMRKPLVLAALGAALLFTISSGPAEAQTVTKAYTDRCALSQFGGPVITASTSVTQTSGGSRRNPGLCLYGRPGRRDRFDACPVVSAD